MKKNKKNKKKQEFGASVVEGEMVEVLDLSELVIEDVFNNSYLESQHYRGIDGNSSFFPGDARVLGTIMSNSHSPVKRFYVSNWTHNGILADTFAI